MINVFRRWIDRYLSNEEALLLLVLIGVFLLVIGFMGNVLAPFFNRSGGGLLAAGKYAVSQATRGRPSYRYGGCVYYVCRGHVDLVVVYPACFLGAVVAVFL
jgi:hypothetical protein